MPATVLRDVASQHRLYLAAKPSHGLAGGGGGGGMGAGPLLPLCCWGGGGPSRGWATLPPAPSYGLQPLDEGTWHFVRKCLISSCCNRRWCLLRGCEARARIFNGGLTVWVWVLPNLYT
jgi:hypothetical protein